MKRNLFSTDTNRLLSLMGIVVVYVFTWMVHEIPLTAHGIWVRIEKKPPLIVIKAGYDAGKTVSDASVTVRHGAGREPFKRGSTDSSGSFGFTPDKPGQWEVMVDDGMGHRQTESFTLEAGFFEGKQGETEPAGPPPMGGYLVKVLLGVLLILGVTFLMKRLQQPVKRKE
ncbi:MAG: carboxypeptidase regulatory-like domain-containing protein [bacterium]|nr:carboxypeptidase regulatory-like domain-containing protein [bacterium]